MTALTGKANGVEKVDDHVSSEPGFGIVAEWSRTSALLALVLLLCIGQLRAGQQQPAKSSSHFQQVESLVQQGHLEEARAAMLDELKRNPASVDGYNLLGIIESNLQDYSNALAAFEKALQLSPNSAKTHNNLGNFYISQKEPDLAEKEFRTTLRLDPANQDGNYNLCLLYTSRCV